MVRVRFQFALRDRGSRARIVYNRQVLGAALEWSRRASPCTLRQVPLAATGTSPQISLETRSYVLMAEPIVPSPLKLPEDCNEAARGRLALNDAVEILVVEDDQLIQAMVEEALSD